MRLIDWNISFKIDAGNALSLIERHLEGKWIATLQEVKSHHIEAIREAFDNRADIEYSLEYRKPGRFDTDSRKLGVAILCGGGLSIENAGVFDRSLLPDRTLWAQISDGRERITVVSLHALTGCSHVRAKSLQFYSLAESIDVLRPDIVTIDANEPEIDHYNIDEMEFFDQKNDGGKGAATFFEAMRNVGLIDSYAEGYDKTKFIKGEPLAISHVIRGKKPVNRRYDFVMTSARKFEIEDCRYLYDEAKQAGGDHAIVITDLKLNQCENR